MKTTWCLLRLSFLFFSLWACPRIAHAYYDPSLARWINRDPIAERGGLALHRFVRNAPITHRDLWGHSLNAETPSARNELFESLPADYSHVQCDGNGNFEIVISPEDQESPWRHCAIQHEEQHLRDMEERFGVHACDGVPRGSTPVGPDYDAFRRQTECAANKQSLECMRRTCFGPSDYQRIQDQILAHETALRFWNCN
jgi:hypothetical protein